MNAPLYDIKARFSEYVTMAENGEVIEITKHGNCTAVIISKKNYDKMNSDYQENHRPDFMQAIMKWRNKNAEFLDDEYANHLEKLVQEDKQYFDSGVNPWE